jgi:hypothetical protein
MEKDTLSQGRARESNSGKADEPTYRTSIAVDPLTPRHNPATGGTPSLKSSANNPKMKARSLFPIDPSSRCRAPSCAATTPSSSPMMARTRDALAPLKLYLALHLIHGDFEVAYEGHPQQP